MRRVPFALSLSKGVSQAMPFRARASTSSARTHEGAERPDDESGFTLVELMVVIVIIGLLATIVAINVLPSGDKARVTRARADISTIEGALDMYKLQNGAYPTTGQGLAALVSAPAGGNAATYQPGGYIKGGKVPTDPWGRPYNYVSPGTHGEADVWSFGADGKEGGSGTDADIGNWPEK